MGGVEWCRWLVKYEVCGKLRHRSFLCGLLPGWEGWGVDFLQHWVALPEQELQKSAFLVKETGQNGSDLLKERT